MRQLSSFVLTALAVTASACGPSVASTTNPSPSGDFRVLLPGRPLSLNPNVALDEIAILIGRSIFNHLLAINESGRLLPELAETWSVAPDGLTYTFTLRAGVRWHDGAPFTSADVKWTLNQMQQDGYGGQDALAPMASIDTPDDATVIIRLRHPWAPFAADLSGPGLAMLPRHIYAGTDWKTHPANHRPVGTGAFRFGHWEDERTLVLDANPAYFRSGPYVARIIFEAASPDLAREKMLRGEGDYSVRASTIDPRQPADAIVTKTLPTSGRYYVAMNLRRRPFDDVRVREALASAVDRIELVGKALAGLGAPAIGWYTPDVEWAYNPAARVPEHSLPRARRLLDAAGLRLRNGNRFRSTMVVPNTPPVREIAELLRQQFGRIGVELAIETMPLRDWPVRVLGDHDFDLTILSGAQGPDPDQLRRRFLAGTETGDYIGYDAAEFREAVDRGARAIEVADRAAAYHRAQEILARDIPFIPLAEAVRVVVHNRRVSGLPQLEARGLVGGFDFSLVRVAPANAQAAR